MRLTYGAEFEFADIRRDVELPKGATWNTKDYSIVSSTGIANDPKGKLYNLGGEINTVPTDNIEEQVEILYRIVDARKGGQRQLPVQPALAHRSTGVH